MNGFFDRNILNKNGNPFLQRPRAVPGNICSTYANKYFESLVIQEAIEEIRRRLPLKKHNIPPSNGGTVQEKNLTNGTNKPRNLRFRSVVRSNPKLFNLSDENNENQADPEMPDPIELSEDKFKKEIAGYLGNGDCDEVLKAVRKSEEFGLYSLDNDFPVSTSPCNFYRGQSVKVTLNDVNETTPQRHHRKRRKFRDTILGPTIAGLNLTCVYLCAILPDGSVVVQIKNQEYEDWKDQEIRFDKTKPVETFVHNRWYAATHCDENVIYVQRAKLHPSQETSVSQVMLLDFLDEGYSMAVDREGIFEIENYAEVDRHPLQAVTVSVVGLTNENYTEEELLNLENQFRPTELFYAIPIDGRNCLRAILVNRKGHILSVR